MKSVSEVNDELIYQGEGVLFEDSPTKMGRIVSALFSHSTGGQSQLTLQNVKNIFYHTSTEDLCSFRQELQRVLLQAFENRKRVPEEIFTLFIHQTLTLFSFASLEEGFEMQVPVKVGDQWELQTYKLDKKFALGRQFLLSPIPAYGFTSSAGGPPLLIFMGTTYPAAHGFVGTLLADFNPFLSVGRLPFFFEKRNIGNWLEQHPNAEVMGVSLGGALSLRAAKHFGQYISKVFAFLPPGSHYGEHKRFKNSPAEINLLFQRGDMVTSLGYFPQGKNVHLYHICEDKKSNPLSAHARVFLSGKNVTVYKGLPNKENGRITRAVFTALHVIVSPPIFVSLMPLYVFATLRRAVEIGLEKLKK